MTLERPHPADSNYVDVVRLISDVMRQSTASALVSRTLKQELHHDLPFIYCLTCIINNIKKVQLL